MNEESAVFRAIADETRRDILRLLAVARRPVGDLAASFPHISRPAVSKHLRILRQAGLVSERRDGRRRLYRLRPQALAAIGRWLQEVETPSAVAAMPRGRRPGRGAARPEAAAGGLRPLRRPEPGEPGDPDWRTW